MNKLYIKLLKTSSLAIAQGPRCRVG